MKEHIYIGLSVLMAYLLCSCSGSNIDDKGHLNYAAVRLTKGSAWCIIDTDGNVVLDSVFGTEKVLTLAYDGAFWVADDNGFQLYNVEHPDKPLTPVYKSATSFRQGRAFVSNGNEPIKMIDTKGKVIATLPQSISRAWEFSANGLAQCMEGGAYSYIDVDGRFVFRVEAKKTFVGDDYLCVQDANGESFSIYNRRGMKTGQFDFRQYLAVGCFTEGLLPVIKDPIVTYGNGRAMIDWHKPITYLNEKGEEQFTIAGSKHTTGEAHDLNFGFLDDYTIFTTGESHYGIANNKGEIIVQPDYEELKNIGDGFFVAQRGYKHGIIKVDGTEIIPFDHDLDARAVMMFGDNFVIKRYRDDIQLVSLQGDVKKTFASFSTQYPCKDFVDYINAGKMIKYIVGLIEELDHRLTPNKVANKVGITPTKDWLYMATMSLTTTFDDGNQYIKHQYIYDGPIISPNRNEPYGEIVSLSWNMPDLEEVKIDCCVDNSTSIKYVYDSIVRELKQKGAVEVEQQGWQNLLPQLEIHRVNLKFSLSEVSNELNIFCILPQS